MKQQTFSTLFTELSPTCCLLCTHYYASNSSCSLSQDFNTLADFSDTSDGRVCYVIRETRGGSEFNCKKLDIEKRTCLDLNDCEDCDDFDYNDQLSITYIDRIEEI